MPNCEVEYLIETFTIPEAESRAKDSYVSYFERATKL